MEWCFTFQWGKEGCFSDVGASFLSGGVSHEGASVLMGEGFSKKIVGWRGLPTMGNPEILRKNLIEVPSILKKYITLSYIKITEKASFHAEGPI